jgi:hypothetical protein
MRNSAANFSGVAVMLIFFAAALLVIALSQGRLSDAEASALWIVRDDAPVWAVGPRDALRGLRANLGDLLARLRERGQPPLYYVALDVWTMLAGESLLAARIFSTFAAMIAAAILVRLNTLHPVAALTGLILCALTGAMIDPAALWIMLALLALWALRRGRMILCALAWTAALLTHVAAIVLLPVVICLWGRTSRRIARGERIAVGVVAAMTIAVCAPLLIRPDWGAAIRAMNGQRAPTDPAITLIEPGSALAFFDRQPGTHVRQGISLDLAWRDHSQAEITALVNSVAGAPAVWIIMPRDHPKTGQVITGLEPTHAPGITIEVGDMLLRRYDQITAGEP